MTRQRLAEVLLGRRGWAWAYFGWFLLMVLAVSAWVFGMWLLPLLIIAAAAYLLPEFRARCAPLAAVTVLAVSLSVVHVLAFNRSFDDLDAGLTPPLWTKACWPAFFGAVAAYVTAGVLLLRGTLQPTPPSTTEVASNSSA